MYLYFLYLSHLFVFIEQVLRNKIAMIDLLSYYSKEGSLFYYVKLAFIISIKTIMVIISNKEIKGSLNLCLIMRKILQYNVSLNGK